jgi:hypothetical protein
MNVEKFENKINTLFIPSANIDKLKNGSIRQEELDNPDYVWVLFKKISELPPNGYRSHGQVVEEVLRRTDLVARISSCVWTYTLGDKIALKMQNFEPKKRKKALVSLVVGACIKEDAFSLSAYPYEDCRFNSTLRFLKNVRLANGSIIENETDLKDVLRPHTKIVSCCVEKISEQLLIPINPNLSSERSSTDRTVYEHLNIQ